MCDFASLAVTKQSLAGNGFALGRQHKAGNPLCDILAGFVLQVNCDEAHCRMKKLLGHALF